MQVTAVVYVALLLVVGGCAADEAVEADETMEDSGSGMWPLEEATGAELIKESRLGGKASLRSRFPAALIGYNRYYPGYSPEYYYPLDYRSYYPAYPSNYYPLVNYPPVNYPTNNYPPVSYPTNYPPLTYPTSNYYPPSYPYEYPPYGAGVNEYSARHERA